VAGKLKHGEGDPKNCARLEKMGCRWVKERGTEQWLYLQTVGA
jgi:hypothetical protein